MGLGILGKAVGGGLKEPIDAIGGIIDELFTSGEEKLNAKEVMARIKQRPHLAQNATNNIEASHRTIFVAGWRPFIGWVGGIAILWHYVLFDLLSWCQGVFMPETPPLPKLASTEQLMTIVLGMLGLGGMRTYEKMKGRSK